MNVADRWPMVIGTWVVTATALVVWLRGTPEAGLRQQLSGLHFWWLEATLWAVVALGLLAARRFGHHLQRRDRWVLGALAAVALVVTLRVAPSTNRIYYDEQIYQGIGQNLADLRRAQMCNDGTVEYGRLQCWSGEYNKQPYAFPHLLSLAYRIAGVREGAAFAVNAAVAALAPVLLYLFVLVHFADRTAAAGAGLVLALTPHQAIWSATAAVEPSAALASVAALLAATWYCRTADLVALAATAIVCAYAAQFRTESALVIPVVALMIWQERRAEFARPRFWWVVWLGLVLLALHVGHLYAVRNDSWGSPEARLSLRYVAQNLRVNGAFYLVDERFPTLFTLAACAGLFVSGLRASRWPLIVHFLAFFGIGLLFYAGSYDYGADVRYSLMTYPPLAVLAGLGLAGLARRAAVIAPGVPVRACLAAVLVVQWLWYAPVVRATTEEAWAARADVRFAATLAPTLRGNQYVLTHNPAMFHVWGVNAGQMSMVMTNPSHLEYLQIRYPGGVYLHWNFWCNVSDPIQREVCTRALAIKPSQSVQERLERDQRFVLYRFAPTIHGPAPPPSALQTAPLPADTPTR